MSKSASRNTRLGVKSTSRYGTSLLHGPSRFSLQHGNTSLNGNDNRSHHAHDHEAHLQVALLDVDANNAALPSLPTAPIGEVEDANTGAVATANTSASYLLYNTTETNVLGHREPIDGLVFPASFLTATACTGSKANAPSPPTTTCSAAPTKPSPPFASKLPISSCFARSPTRPCLH